MTGESRGELRRLGAAGPSVFPLALGCMGMSGMYGPADEGESIATIHAAEKRLRPSQLAVAWVLAKGESIGARTRAQLSEALRAVEVRLSREELARIESAVPASAAAGTRYDEHQMKMLDSER